MKYVVPIVELTSRFEDYFLQHENASRVEHARVSFPSSRGLKRKNAGFRLNFTASHSFSSIPAVRLRGNTLLLRENGCMSNRGVNAEERYTRSKDSPAQMGAVAGSVVAFGCAEIVDPCVRSVVVLSRWPKETHLVQTLWNACYVSGSYRRIAVSTDGSPVPQSASSVINASLT
ncbi:unnamed protein product [Protopolystoma xenopodis]|uniref:Uncharacterized protein n=1 Tax=Protopolystoma xenopodis TaxID=117903 RepID=A0A3S5CCV7_9PLAT|nr:unnamed protein product [Protopolystoma xenopodis]